MQPEVQQKIISKAFRNNKIPFVREGETFHWFGKTRVTSKNTGIVYPIEVSLSLTTSARLAEQVSACLLKSEGIRMEDLMIAGMIDPKLRGRIDIKGLPKDKLETDLGRFIKKLNKPT